MDYRVQLDIYNGPLDLLLYLIKRDELDIYDIPIARITESYMHYIGLLGDIKDAGFDIDLASDFLVMAATLMEIKSAMLLPRQTADSDSDNASASLELTDPRYELVQQLLEYKRFKDAALQLDHQLERHQQRFARIPAHPGDQEDELPPLDMDEVQVWDLLEAFNRLMQEVGFRKPRYHEVTYDDTPIDLHAADIEDRLRRDGRLTLRQLIAGRKNRSEMIGVFLALLELVRQKKVLIQQEQIDSELLIEPAPHAPDTSNDTDASDGPDVADDADTPATSGTVDASDSSQQAQSDAPDGNLPHSDLPPGKPFSTDAPDTSQAGDDAASLTPDES